MSAYIYCVSCMANMDGYVAGEIQRFFPVRAISLTFDREEHKNGKWTVKTYPLLWGYVFVYAEEPLPLRRIYGIDHVIRVLQYGDGESNLSGEDRAFAEWALENNGHIGLSRALLAGDRTRIIDGPLKDYEGVIRSLNRQKGKALVDIAIGDEIKSIWLYFEWMTLRDGQLVKLRENSPGANE